MTLLSPWGEALNNQHPLPEYPRMQLRRKSYTNLNGIWEFQITDQGQTWHEGRWELIVVPFALGSRLCGCQRQLLPGQILWYRLHFSYQPSALHTILNFEAVDQKCTVYLNDLLVGSHAGGYAPFSFDVSQMIKVENTLIVSCTDDSDQGLLAYGKQKIQHGGMWYTPSGGIWQTVWLEDIGIHAVQDVKITPDYDNGKVYFRMAGNFSQAVISVLEQGVCIHRGITNDMEYTLPLEHFHAWSPDDPFLYDVVIQTEDDEVHSYFGMRKFSVMKDESGIPRFCLNDHPLFLSGLLDQGYSVDGLMTYPADEAMVFELQKIKELGFNTLRKHVKEECRRWYYHCDRLGILVLQDMPSGGGPYQANLTAVWPTLGFRRIKDDAYEKFGRASSESRQLYYEELDQMLDALYNFVCICAWVPFNEGWGQFDSALVTKHIRAYDSTRLIDSASGWHDQGAGDFNSRHVYFRPFRVPLNSDGRILLLSEFGGYSYLESGHSQAKKLYGYRKYKDKIRLDQAINDLYRSQILNNVSRGLSGCIYTQVSDVEDECNGLFTADRRVLKIDQRKMKKMNERIYRSMSR